MNEKDFEAQNIFGKGGANTAYAKYFIGNSFLNPVKIGGGDCPVMIANVTFEPGCRNNWHIHHASPAAAGSSWKDKILSVWKPGTQLSFPRE